MTDEDSQPKIPPRVREFVIPGNPWTFPRATDEQRRDPRPESEQKSFADMIGHFPPEWFEGFDEAIRELRGRGPNRKNSL